LLAKFKAYYSEMLSGVGMAMSIHENIKVKKVDSLEILSVKEIDRLKTTQGFKYYHRIMQSVYLKKYYGLIIHNFHGIAGQLKKDTAEIVL